MTLNVKISYYQLIHPHLRTIYDVHNGQIWWQWPQSFESYMDSVRHQTSDHNRLIYWTYCTDKPMFLLIWTVLDPNELEGKGQITPYTILTKNLPRYTYKLNLEILGLFFPKLLHRQSMSYRRIQTTKIPLSPKWKKGPWPPKEDMVRMCKARPESLWPNWGIVCRKEICEDYHWRTVHWSQSRCAEAPPECVSLQLFQPWEGTPAPG